MAEPDDKPIRKRATIMDALSLADSESGGGSVVHKLGREIVDGTFPPEQRLPDEATMLSRYAVSRTALREAYSKLAAKGMIAARPRVGTSVRPPSDWNMLDTDVLGWHLQTRRPEEIARDLYPIRGMVEPNAAAMAAQHHTAEQLSEIERALEEMHASASEENALVGADLRFHTAILRATGNHFIGVFSSLIHAAMLSTFQISWRAAAEDVIKDERLEQHRQVFEAIKARRPEEARASMQLLLDDSIGDVADVIGPQP